MISTKRISAVAAVVAALMLLGVGCSSDDEPETANTTTTTRASTGTGATSATVNPEYETWCTSVQNLIDQSSPNDLSALADLASFTQAMQSLATTAPEPITAQLQTIATASQTKLEAAEQDPDATLPPEIAQSTEQAVEDVSVFVNDNCGGLQLPTIDL
jgi:hypothetical protein